MFVPTRHVDPVHTRELDADISELTQALTGLSIEGTKEQLYRHTNCNFTNSRTAVSLSERQLEGLQSRIEAVRNKIPALVDKESAHVTRKIQECDYLECRLGLLRQDCQHLLELLKDAAFIEAFTDFTKLGDECTKLVESRDAPQQKQVKIQELFSSLKIPQEGDLPLALQSVLRSFYKNSLYMLLQACRTVGKQMDVTAKIRQIQDLIEKIPDVAIVVGPRTSDAIAADTTKVALRSFYYFNSVNHISRLSYWGGGCKDAVRIGEQNLTHVAKSVQQLADELSDWTKSLFFDLKMPEDFSNKCLAFSNCIAVFSEQIKAQVYANTAVLQGLVQTDYNRLVPAVYAYADALLLQLQDLQCALSFIQNIQTSRQYELGATEICDIFLKLHQERSLDNRVLELVALFNAFQALRIMPQNTTFKILSEALASKSQLVLLQSEEEKALIESAITKPQNVDLSAIALVLAKRIVHLLYCSEQCQLDMELELCLYISFKEGVPPDLGSIFAAYQVFMQAKRLESEHLEEAASIATVPLEMTENQAIAIKRYVRFKTAPTAHTDTLNAMASYLYQRIESQCSKKPFTLQEVITIADLIAQYRPVVAAEGVPNLGPAAAASQM